MTEQRLCDGRVKTRYPDQQSAQAGLQDARHRRGKPKGRDVRKVEKRAYRCPSCDGWHLTSMKEKP